MRAVDCFCASGGLTCGLKAAGFDVAMGIDVDRAALRLYRARHAHPAIELDLSDVSKAVQMIREVGPIDLLTGSPPCTDFSSAGHREERTRVAGLTVSFAQIAVSLRVRNVLLENVPEMLRSQAWAEARDVLVDGGFSLVVLRVNAAACGVAQIRRRVFVIAMLNCNEAELRRVEREASDYNHTPTDAPTVRGCLDTHADTYFCNARNRHGSCVRSVDRPAPTLRCNCLASPPPEYTPRHDDAGPIAEAHVLTVSEMARVASFDAHYFDGVSRTAAGRFLGNCVPPRMAEVVGRWCVQLLCSPVTSIEKPACIARMRRVVNRISRIHRLVDLGLLDRGATLSDDGTLMYIGGTSARGDLVVERVLRWRPEIEWRIQLKPRCVASVGGGQAPLDDLHVYQPGRSQPYRSIRQLLRSTATTTNAHA